MKLYVFLDGDGNIIKQVRAEDHGEAVDLANFNGEVNSDTDFYSEDIE
jgi:phage repressor protein C with HTH and peptisase S24 domain